jgi:hypothetical protein
MIDFQNPAWHQIRRWAEDQLRRAREKNDVLLAPDDTAALRGEIRVLKRIIDLPNAVARENAVDPD